MLQQLRKRLWALGGAPLLLVAAGCPSDDSGDTARARIGADGGQISSRDGVLTIFLPPGALEEAVEVSIAPSEAPPASFGSAYRVEPDIDLAIAAEVSYQGELPLDPSSASIGAISRADFDAGAGSWKPLPRTELHEDADLVVAVDDELSMFYTLLDRGGVAGTGTGTGGSTDPDTDGSTGDPSGSTGEPPGTTGDTETGPLFHGLDIQPIWDANCVTNCHEPGGVNATLDLSGDAYDDIVGVLSLVASAELVAPGAPEDSYLMHKLDGTHTLPENQGGCGCNGAGVLMPQGMMQLDASVRDTIRTWIAQGAEP